MTVVEPTEFSQIVDIIDAGSVVALPTDTIYGLVCKYDYESAIVQIYEMKKRPITKALQILVANWEQAKEIGIFDDHLVRYLEDQYATGHVTVIVKKQELLDKIKYWQQWDSVAIRVTKYPLVQKIIAAVGPLAATSCNISGQKPINDSSKINLPFLEYVVSGKISKPEESTIYDSVTKKIIRS
ncbi:L-threonylcarbamoyladenylate synthase [Spiroplasma platyhelix]|uniref:L-threonylcarbamoyladenylate synthase n=1 Tax=Spiroplasma platyhelix PALS-1 TaxID=1276218 RepID=A0A846U0P6_9MOLU|nr:L-threonylcarbamoyladenylate synthase [Spiroplasma platyhelix]MBE4704221.1 Threonylcarbamoyl-AMP synthase [Spiroplasma platyhelix PALS-1]NKE38594.1 L-threonylcarbamoyladenylate synthase [Spiroplasma platyhelix PALS-1]UJB28805.1 tRNA threonylcarbamoyladenosine biosynthesis protein [Spiroplasma platyhelix PALS-1]